MKAWKRRAGIGREFRDGRWRAEVSDRSRNGEREFGEGGRR